LDTYWFRLSVTALFLVTIPAVTGAQEMQAPPPSTEQAQNAPVYTQAQLDQMVAPIALYPDALVAQILMASTYPLEVVEASRWLQDPHNASLKGDPLAAALEQQPWDPSVKSLVPFPQVLQMMDKNLQWTEQLGDAFLAQQPAVMDSVQQLRQQAQAAGTLKSTPQQVVSTADQAIEIQPANPQVVYVPYYNPTLVYGAWPYPDYPPFYFPPPYGYAYDGAFIGFGVGFGIIAPFWGWDVWDWHHHRIDIDNDRFRRINHDHAPIASGVWQHDPAHRQGVPYHSAVVRTQFQHASAESRRSYRGFNTVAAPRAERASVAAPVQREQTGSFARPATETPTMGAVTAQREQGGRSARPATETPTIGRTSAPEVRSTPVARVASPRPQEQPVVAQRPSVPLFESLPHGADARVQAARGASSRSSGASLPNRAVASPARGGDGGNARVNVGGRAGNERR